MCSSDLGHTVLPAIRLTNGTAIAVDDKAIIGGEFELASNEGLLCEPTCAVVIAALRHLPDVGPDSRVCCVLTGSGIKDLAAIQEHVARPARIDVSLDALACAVNRSK